MGSQESDFNVIHPVKPMRVKGKPVAAMLDHKPIVNIKPFGQCQSLANPIVASATAAANGKLQKMPCVPNTTTPWMGCKMNMRIKGNPALLDSSKLTCLWAGVIDITNPGQDVMKERGTTLNFNADSVKSEEKAKEVAVVAVAIESEEKQESVEKSSDDFGLALAQFTMDNHENYVRASETNSNERLRPNQNPKTGFDCSGWVGYSIYATYKKKYQDKDLSKDYPKFYNNVVMGNTQTMIPYAKDHGGFRLSKPQVGDLVFWKGHVEIVIKVDGDKFCMSGSSSTAPRKVPFIKPSNINPSNITLSTTKMFSGSQDPLLNSWGSNINPNYDPENPRVKGKERKSLFHGFWTIDFSKLK